MLILHPSFAAHSRLLLSTATRDNIPLRHVINSAILVSLLSLGVVTVTQHFNPKVVQIQWSFYYAYVSLLPLKLFLYIYIGKFNTTQDALFNFLFVHL